MNGNFCDWELEGTALKWMEMNGEGVTNSDGTIYGPPSNWNGEDPQSGFLLVNWSPPEGEESHLDDAILATEGRAEVGEIRCYNFWYWVVVSWMKTLLLIESMYAI